VWLEGCGAGRGLGQRPAPDGSTLALVAADAPPGEAL